MSEMSDRIKYEKPVICRMKQGLMNKVGGQLSNPVVKTIEGSYTSIVSAAALPSGHSSVAP